MMNFMRLFLIPTLIGILIAEEQSISVNDLQSKKVMGHLGIPLGEAFTIKAKWIPGRTLSNKADQSIYLLKITQVNERALKKPLLMKFSYAVGADKKLPSNRADLEKNSSKQQRQQRSSTEDVEKLEKQFINREFNLMVYETGRFSGIPNKLPGDFPRWQGTGFRFRSSLIILRHN